MSDRLPVGPGDLYHLFMDRRMRRRGGRGNGSQFLFELDGAADPDDLRDRLDRLLEACPVLGAGLRSWPSHRWEAVPGHRIPLTLDREGGSAQELFDRHYGRPFPPPSEPSFEVVLAPAGDRSRLLLRWLHPLMDAPGAVLLLRILDGEDPARFRLHDLPPSLARRARGGPRWRLAVAVHNFLLRYLLRSIPPPRQRPVAAGEPRVLWHTFGPEETRRIDARVERLAGPLQANHAYMGAAFLAAAGTLDARRGSRLLIPCPVNLRPPAWRGPVFANYFTSVLVQLPVRRLASLPAAVEAVREAFRRALRRREEAATFWMMSLARWLPHPLYSLLMLGPTARDPASVYYSYVNLDVGREGRLLGHELRRCLAASHVLRPPGAALVFSRCAGRLTVAVPHNGFDRAPDLLRRAVDQLRGDGDDEAAG